MQLGLTQSYLFHGGRESFEAVEEQRESGQSRRSEIKPIDCIVGHLRFLTTISIFAFNYQDKKI
jgi:hypothetical protein